MPDTLGIALAGMKVMLWLTLVPLAGLVGVGVVLSLLLSILQIQDQGLPVAVKIFCLVLIMTFLTPWMASMVLGFTDKVFQAAGGF